MGPRHSPAPAGLLLLLLCSFGLGATSDPLPADSDRDGLDDRLEQQLLDQFAPTFYLSRGECDSRPAEMRSGIQRPQVAARNGMIYGQVTPRRSARLAGELVEVHYYHLWGRDCGRFGHRLDVEHVSALLRKAEGQSAWRAVFWYAGAHEGTVCDHSSAARAEALGAERAGASVFVSRGKHASYFSPADCASGCGGDVCKGGRALEPPAIRNLGERGAAMNGALWLESPEWLLAEKLGSDFPDPLIDRLLELEPSQMISAHSRSATAQALILAADSTADAMNVGREKTTRATSTALATGAGKTGGALASSTSAASGAVAKGTRSTGKGVRGALRSTGRFLGLTGEPAKPPAKPAEPAPAPQS